LARRAGLDATSFNPSKRVSAGDPPRPRWPSTESLTLVLQAAGVSLADFAALADDAKALSCPRRTATEAKATSKRSVIW
jgi:hypothetical protein